MAATRVLVVDDDGDLRLLVRLLLEMQGSYVVVGEAGTAAEAADIAAVESPDVVVLDLHLPDLRGPAVLESLRAVAPDVRLVIFSGAALPTDIAGDVDGYVMKGDELSSLVAAIEQAASSAQETYALPEGPSALPVARQLVATACARNRFDAISADAQLVVSELVTNAVVHAGVALELRLTFGDTLRLEVVDPATATPQPRSAEPTDTSGRGLAVVAALSVAWGITPHPAGQVVWAELSDPARTDTFTRT